MPNDTKTLLTGSPEWQQHCIDHLELCPSCDTKSRIAVEQDNLTSASDGSPPPTTAALHGHLQTITHKRHLQQVAANADTLMD